VTESETEPIGLILARTDLNGQGRHRTVSSSCVGGLCPAAAIDEQRAAAAPIGGENSAKKADTANKMGVVIMNNNGIRPIRPVHTRIDSDYRVLDRSGITVYTLLLL
jgi:hypothetical protein